MTTNAGRYAVQVWDGPGQPRRTYDREDEITDCLAEARMVASTMCRAGFVGGGAAVILAGLPDGHPGRVVAEFERTETADDSCEVQP